MERLAAGEDLKERLAGANLVSDIWPLGLREQRDGGVGLWRENVHEGVGVAVQRNGGTGLEQLAVEGGQDAHIVIGSRGGANDARVGVHHLQELAYD